MVDDSHLTAEDHASIQAASKRLHDEGWRKPFTIPEMMSAWTWLVGKVEQGYADYVDEYTNDLYCRDWLDAVWRMVGHPVRACWHEELYHLDERFRAATVDDGGKAVGRYHRIGPDRGWWWRRHPKILVGHLADALADTEPGP